MKQIVLPHIGPSTPLEFFLATEEWVATHLPADDYFFAWQVSPTVICGRHQHIPSEVNLAYAAAHNIRVVRRKSGGGAVYADRQNVMFSYITVSDAVQTTFSRYTALICSLLRSLGIAATPTGRNDIAVNGRKVAGNAFLKLPARSIVHGTMLIDIDLDTMSHVLTPSYAKQTSKGVKSVASRVTSLRAEGLAASSAQFMDYATHFLCPDGHYALSETDIKEVEAIMETYTDPHFLDLPPSEAAAVYIEGVGQIAATFRCDCSGKIISIDLQGDFFPLQNASAALSARLAGCHCSAKDIKQQLTDYPLATVIDGLTLDKFLKLLPEPK